jgi:hypothetical protein
MRHFFDIYRNRTPILFSFIALIAVLVAIAFTSIYAVNSLVTMSTEAKQKLLPAVVTAEIAEYLTENRLYIEEHIASESTSRYSEFERAIYVNYQRIDSLLTKYNEEYTQREAENKIGKYRDKWRRYKEVETKILYMSKKGDKKEAQVIFLGKSTPNFQELVRTVGDLTNKHVIEGEQKYAALQVFASYIKFVIYSAIGIAFLIVIGLGIIMGLNFYQ